MPIRSGNNEDEDDDKNEKTPPTTGRPDLNKLVGEETRRIEDALRRQMEEDRRHQEKED